MKRILSVLLSLVILGGILSGCGVDGSGQPSESVLTQHGVLDGNGGGNGVTDGNGKFAFDIFKKLNSEDKGGNIFISPFSISTALTMVYQGAEGTTKEAMEKTLGLAGLSEDEINESYKDILKYLKKADKSVDLDINNSIWIRKGFEVKKDFIDINKGVFNAYVASLDFSDSKAADTINKWIKDSTKGRIDKMLDSPIAKDIVMYLVNAIYFKGKWSETFDVKSTFDAKFNGEGGKINDIKMMRRSGTLEYAKTDEYRAVRLPYGKGEIAMYCILPEKDADINKYIEGMTFDMWEDIRKSLVETDDVLLQIPRFKMEYGIKELNDALIGLGMGEAFADNADFKGISDGIAISRVLHKAVIEVNEEGSTAAGVTAAEMKLTALAVDPPQFIADRPFLFFIADDETGTVLFMGKVGTIDK